MTLRLLLVDDHEVVRIGFREMIAGTDVELAGEAATGGEAVRVAQYCDWDLAVVDIELPDTNGFHVIDQLREIRPQAPAILFAEYDYPRFASWVASKGISALLLKSATRSVLLETVKAARTAKPGRPRKPEPSIDSHANIYLAACLTDREHQVLKQLATGSTNKAIAQSLGISYETVKEHVQHILHKLGVADRTQAAVWAVRKGLL